MQPIEVIWGGVKNRIAVAPAKSMADLKKKLGESLSLVSSRTWRGAYRKVQKKEDEYMTKVIEDKAKRQAIVDAADQASLVEHTLESYTFQC